MLIRGIRSVFHTKTVTGGFVVSSSVRCNSDDYSAKMDARLGLKHFPDGPSLVRSIAKAPARLALVAVRARSVGFVGYAFDYGGYRRLRRLRYVFHI